jgi:uncharacterized protein YndB with AHSA1/START domain
MTTTTQDRIATATVDIDAAPERVWRALVTPAAIKQYMFGADVRSDWRQDAPITWSGEFQGKPYQDKGVIKRIEAPLLLQYTHFSPLSGQPDRPESYHTVTIELVNSGGRTRLILTQDNNPTDDARAHSEKNWRMMLEGLKKFVEAGNPR